MTRLERVAKQIENQLYKLNGMSEIKTSKIKQVVGVNDHTNQHGTTYYHNLVMENGDKINIGKKKTQQVGWELTYQITGHGQQEFNKAKGAQPDNSPGQTNSTRSNNPPSREFKSDPDKNTSIQKQKCLDIALQFCVEDGFSGSATTEEKAKKVADYAKYFYEEIFDNGKS